MQHFHSPHRVLVFGGNADTEVMAAAILVALVPLEAAIDEQRRHLGTQSEADPLFRKHLTQLQESKRTLRELYDALVQK